MRLVKTVDQIQRIGRCRTEGRVVENAPGGNAAASQLTQPGRERIQIVVFIRRVVSPWRAMQTKICEPTPSAGLASSVSSRRIRGHACDFEFIQKAIGAALEPARVPR